MNEKTAQQIARMKEQTSTSTSGDVPPAKVLTRLLRKTDRSRYK